MKKTVEVTYGELGMLKQAVDVVVNEIAALDVNLPIKLFYALQKNQTFLTVEDANFQAMRKRITDHYAITDAEGQYITEQMEASETDPNPQQQLTFKTDSDKENFIEAQQMLIQEEASLKIYSFPDIGTMTGDVTLPPKTGLQLSNIVNWYEEASGDNQPVVSNSSVVDGIIADLDAKPVVESGKED